MQPVRLPEDGEECPDGIVGRKLPVALPQDAVKEFEEFCRERAVTPFAGMLAVYFVLLQRWAGASDITVGMQVVNRPHPDLFKTIGFFSNTVALRCQVAPTQTFDELLDAVSETVYDQGFGKVTDCPVGPNLCVRCRPGHEAGTDFQDHGVLYAP